MTVERQAVAPMLLGVWRRRRLPMAIIFAVALVTAAATAFLWPPTYVSSGTILIEQQEVPVDLVRSTISSFADQRIQMINQRVMTSENLLTIINKYGLYAQERGKRGREAILAMIRDDIGFSSIKASVIDPRQGRPVEATIAFSLSYSNRSPDIAARVANELSSLYLQENLESRRRLAEQAAAFLTEESAKLSARIGELDAELARFKERHVNNLPDMNGLNVQLFNRARDERRDIDSRLSSLDQQLVYLQAQLSQLSKVSPVYASTGERVMAPADRLKHLRTEHARASALYNADHPDLRRMKRELEGLEASVADEDDGGERQRRLQDARTELAALRERYAPDHPDLQRQERLVQSLETAPAAPAGNAVPPDQPDNPAYIQLHAQYDAVSNDRAALERRRSELSDQIAGYESRMAAAPGIEQEYMALARELDSTQLKYREVSQKRMEAELAQSLEDERKGERFTLIEPPLAPDEPSSPNRRLILVAGIVLALVLAGGLAALLEAGDTSIRGRLDVASLLTIPPLAVIPWVENSAQRAARVRRLRYAVAGSVAGLALAVVAVHYLYRPLDVLWAVAMRRLLG